MWVWECPEKPGVKNEHHSKATADILLRNHVTGVFVFGLKPCSYEHVLIDDGVPCRLYKCSAPYIRHVPFVQLQLFYSNGSH